jgi:2-oxoisovalerate dehydrogenase E1 component beta subunit
VVRLPYGGHTGDLKRLLGGGPFHSQCPEAWFLRTPGWKIVAPATPRDAYGLLTAAVRDGNPVIYLEAKGLYGFFRPDLKEEVPVGGWFEVPIGRACVRREGTDVSVFAYGPVVHTALEAAQLLAQEGISVEVVDLRSLEPMDWETIERSVAKTHRVVIAHEDTVRGGVGAEIAAQIAQRRFWDLDAPVVRIGAPDVPPPYSPPLEYWFLPKSADIIAAVRSVIEVSQ